LTELIELYKEDAARVVLKMKAILSNWKEIQAEGAARQDLRRVSHQMRGSGRTYGFHNVTKICKAMENIMLKLEKKRLRADDRVRASLERKIERLASIFPG